MTTTKFVFSLILSLCLQNTFGFNEIKKKIKDGDVKLVDGTLKTEGTVLVYRGYGWGSICDDHWTITEANIVCRQLGMERAINYYTRNFFQTYGIKNYLMDEVYCHGNESKISECIFSGWGRHDCKKNELVGVQCFKLPEIDYELNWNPLNIPLPQATLSKLKKNNFKVFLDETGENFTGIVVSEIDGIQFPLCPQNIRGPEINVLCRQFYGLFGGKIDLVTINVTRYSHEKYITRIGNCYGNETNVSECITYAHKEGIPCESKHMFRINCVTVLPDIIADYSETERSSYMERLSLWHLQCALTEKCLPDSIYVIIEKNPNSYHWITRNLLRFSSIIENIGNDSFLPLEKPENWEWHGCHLHYHSMKIFAIYEIIDAKKNIVANGHKASFCLEDNICHLDHRPHFKCGNTMFNKGTQGISPGCKDTYFHEYDCQWIDITDIVPGTYVFQMVINPHFAVGETDYFNNGISCTLYNTGYNAVLRSCSWQHPYDLL